MLISFVTDTLQTPLLCDDMSLYTFSIFDLLRTDTAGDGFDRPRGGIHIMGTTGMGPMHPLSLLATMLGGGRIGDAVYSQEELDRVISQLVDQNMNQGAPPAALRRHRRGCGCRD